MAVLTIWSMAGRQAQAQMARDCSVCHRSIHQDWLKSNHSKAWKSERFQSQLKQFGNNEFCGSCHAPASVWKQVDMVGSEEQPASFQALLAKRAPWRNESPGDGVSCTSCHYIEVLRQRSKGSEFIGPYHSTAGHGGNEVADFRSFHICSACHGRPAEDYLPPSAPSSSGFHHLGAIDFDFDFERSNCPDCHMPARQEKLVQLKAFANLPERRVGEHSFSGKRYQQLATGLEFTLNREGGRTMLLISNARIGHPMRISPDTSYRIDLSRMKGEEAVETKPVDLSEAHTLTLGRTMRIPVPFENLAPGELQVDLFRKEGDLWQAKVFSKRF